MALIRSKQAMTADVLIGALTRMERFLTVEERTGKRKKGSRWRDYLREAAEAGAWLLLAAPEEFHGLNFDAADLAEGPRRLRELEQAREALALRLAQVDRAINWNKEQLAERTRRLHEALGHKLADSTQDPARRERLFTASLALRRAFRVAGERQESRRKRSLRKGQELSTLRNELALATERLEGGRAETAPSRMKTAGSGSSGPPQALAARASRDS